MWHLYGIIAILRYLLVFSSPNGGSPKVGDVRFYIDGTDTFWVRSECDSVYFTGKIDDVRIYNRTLSKKEIHTLPAIGN